MGESSVNRRRVLGAAAATAAGAGAGWLSGSAAAGQRPLLVPQNRENRENRRELVPGESIADALDAGYQHLSLAAGTFTVGDTITLPRGATLRGAGQSSRLVATAPMRALVRVGAGGPADGCEVSSLVLDCAEVATIGLDLEITGTAGNYQDEPDPTVRLDNLWVYDSAGDGISYRGKDCRSVLTTRARVRRARGHGISVRASDCMWIACEATTYSPQTSSGGVFVNGTNNVFDGCKAWYCRDYGWLVRGTRNRFIGCEAQDTRSHGWLIEYDKNTFVGCVADTAGMYDVGGVAGDADGFHVIAAGNTALVGCMSFDRQPGGRPAQQRWGFSVPEQLFAAQTLVAPIGWGSTSGLVEVRTD